MKPSPHSPMTQGLFIGGEFVAPWRNVSGVDHNGAIIYYAAPPPSSGCLSCLSHTSPALVRHELPPPLGLAEHVHAPIGIPPAGERVLLIVNPKAGKGSKAVVEETMAVARKILREAQIEVVVRTTEKAGHAQEMLEQYGAEQLVAFAAIVCMGGDGTLHEVLNGLVTALRASSTEPDWSKVPALAVLPSGSGNAVAVSTGIVSAHHAALNVVHSLRTHSAKPLAVMQYRRLSQSGRERLAIGGVQWGLPANVDQGTEHLRFMGDTRFTIGVVEHIAWKQSSRARIRVTVDVEAQARLTEQLEAGWRREGVKRGGKGSTEAELIGDDTYVLDGQFVMCVAWNSSKIADGFMVTPFAKVSETGMFDLIVVRASVSRRTMLQMMKGCEDGSFATKMDCFSYFKATRVEFEQVEGAYLTVDGEAVPVEPFVLEIAPEDSKLRVLDAFSDACRKECVARTDDSTPHQVASTLTEKRDAAITHQERPPLPTLGTASAYSPSGPPSQPPPLTL